MCVQARLPTACAATSARMPVAHLARTTTPACLAWRRPPVSGSSARLGSLADGCSLRTTATAYMPAALLCSLGSTCSPRRGGTRLSSTAVLAWARLPKAYSARTVASARMPVAPLGLLGSTHLPLMAAPACLRQRRLLGLACRRLCGSHCRIGLHTGCSALLAWQHLLTSHGGADLPPAAALAWAHLPTAARLTVA